ARRHQVLTKRTILQAFDQCDVLVCPATTGAAPGAVTTGNPAFNSPWSYTGLPTVSFPVSLSTDGLPLAVQLVGLPLGEERLFRVARWCEHAIRASET
ncbi:MAG: amidase family protein, partial [Planctomycetaceae bacterium]